ncbi:phosphoglycerate mutase family protein [Aestuariirhabdus sp. Z084]|uniref:histidine phosphatase family protein n=1 Tax=Aestuariirhabdus haliotis TaxID=2918751 RepID=UPI00201B3B81|nr:histidine phosphatase family protein [Aestuariirhabdus haliotis]MCL6417360.1 phosphoglycerate mutase family protein [Aestuariirhabdus haliotis]MCL6421305.1 phosphoglycerate mutase family protein [Aestuariirhabdus haliotis]
MSDIYLVRHGQASFGAENYDQLSELGYQQSRWLGEYFEQQGVHFDRIVMGGQARHRQTAESLCSALSNPAPLECLEGFSEYDFEAILHRYLEQNPALRPNGDESDRSVYYRLLIKALHAWSANELEGDLPESWQQFEQRVEQSLQQVRDLPKGSNTLIVSSGGAISLAATQVLQAPACTMISLNLQLRNTGVTRLRNSSSRAHLFSFNEMYHLDHSDRQHAITFS